MSTLKKDKCILCDAACLIDAESKRCELCRISNTMDKDDTFRYIIGRSKLQQNEINKITVEGLYSVGEIVSPNEIDKECILLDVNPHLFRTIYSMLGPNDKKVIGDIRIFYTNAVDRNKIRGLGFMKKFPNQKLSIEKFCTNRVKLSEIEKNLYEKKLREYLIE